MASRARIVDAATGRLVAVAEMAETPWRRTVGLLGRDGLPAGEAMVLDPCRSIHTWFMRFPIDVLFLDATGEIVAARERVRPFGYASGTRRARLTIELPAGATREAGLSVGSRLRIDRT
jgi:uncharacterized membrane protein (UPF0127 family)